jgi:cytochrome c biogenesis protein CcmG, thiol:disulfide interchange protein DsbE
VRRVALPALAVLAVAGLIAFEVASAGSGAGARKPAPALPAAVLQPPRETLSGLRGKPALINFWASWCDPCRKEAPELERFNRSLGASARLVGVDYTDQNGAAQAFIRQYGWTFPVLSDPNGVYGARYGFSGLPTTVVLDSRGRIAETLRGPQTVSDLRQALKVAQQS